MKKIGGQTQLRILIGVFIVSRIITVLLGLHLNIRSLSIYWQYLDLETLRNHLISGVWYDHSQPPVFNLLLGTIFKIGGDYSVFLFTFFFKLISLLNGLFIFSIISRLTRVPYLPLLAGLAYLLSPATLIFECELFYTTTISLLLLVSVYYLVRISESGKTRYIFGIIFPMVLLCLTRSVYHIIWFILIVSFLLFYFRKKTYVKSMIFASAIGLVLVSSWYIKNKILFGKLTTSTWIGMNLARNVFHDNEVTDSGRIEAYEPFSRIGLYRKFLDSQYENKFRGMNDRDLLQENKNDTIMNVKEVSYIPVSDLYMKASLEHIRSHPVAYAQNVLQSSILYFTPGTIYTFAIEPSEKIKYYDIPYSFNLTHFAHSKMGRRVLLTISAFPKLLLYLFVFFVFIRNCVRNKSIDPYNLFILITIAFVFGISSLLEHYENMRFRFETEPLFMIMAAQVISNLYSRIKSVNPNI
jgi:hypothetical protein